MEKGSLGSNNVQMKQERSSFVVDMKARRYRLVFPEGKGILRGRPP